MMDGCECDGDECGCGCGCEEVMNVKVERWRRVIEEEDDGMVG